jgi:periplasmic protein CpxP/Spy
MRGLRAIRVGAALAACIAIGVAAGAQAPPPGGGFGLDGHRQSMDQPFGGLGAHGRFWNNPAIISKLQLTDEQRKAMDAILQQHLESLVDLRANAEKAELALGPLINADQLDEQKILAQIDQVAAARAELFKANARFLLAIRGKLTQDQWKQVQEFRAEHAGAASRWRQGGPQGPPPTDAPQ